MAASVQIRSETQRSLAFGSIGENYTLIASALARPVRILIVQNLTDALLQFSYDGFVNHFVLPAGGQMIIDGTTNRVENANGFFFSIGTRISVKRIETPTKGSVYLSTLYAGGS